MVKKLPPQPGKEKEREGLDSIIVKQRLDARVKAEKRRAERIAESIKSANIKGYLFVLLSFKNFMVVIENLRKRLLKL